MKTYAIIEAGGEQFQVEPGRFYDVRHLVSGIYSKIPTLDSIDIKLLLYRILMIRNRSVTIIGTPWIKYAAVKGRILGFYRNQKVIIYKMRSKKKTRKKMGYRQLLIRFVVDGIYIKGNELNIN